MRGRYFLLALGLQVAMMACTPAEKQPYLTGKTYQAKVPGTRLSLITTDTTLAARFSWAARQALSYVHDGSDPVGLWYEAALPGREAFCMRDVAHQSSGAHLLGLADHNKNMLKKFAANVAASRNWCSFWEINRQDKPAPVDYRNDREFWYNLPANYDVLSACYRQYLWTGDEDYLEDKTFTSFYDHTVTDYTHTWQLGPDEIMQRNRWLHSPQPFDSTDNLHIARGLPSYEEGNPLRLLLGADLLAFEYNALQNYARMLRLHGRSARADLLKRQANKLQDLFDEQWWDEAGQSYYQTLFSDRGFVSRPTPFILYNDFVRDAARRQKEITRLATLTDSNIETQTYLPLILFRHDRNAAAYRHLIDLSRPDKPRRDYPEVSFTWIEALVSGLAGVEADAFSKSIKTLYRLPNDTLAIQLNNIPVFNGGIDVAHLSPTASVLHNRTGETIRWKAAFYGQFDTIYYNGEPVQAVALTTPGGKTISYIDVYVKDMETGRAEVMP